MNENAYSELREEENVFTREKIVSLLELYKLYKGKVQSNEIKTMKKLWERVAMDLSNMYKITIMPGKCENKFRVLERSYKKMKDNNNRTGRSRKDFPYEAEFDDIFGKRVNILPKVLLGTEQVASTLSMSTSNIPSTSTGVIDCSVSKRFKMSPRSTPSTSENYGEVYSRNKSLTSSYLEDIHDEENEPPVLTIPDSPKQIQRKRKRPTSTYTKRNEILMEMKDDFKKYYTEKLKLEKEKLGERKKRTQILEELVKDH
ncbi:myb/sant-like dna-binding domain [Holotrichia oblita]|uniref:Myb/sant-like dna-binding domain n=1 Tax=Holotrichia oblita TaxID=644536 RepID=A0ACB9TM65_HOLOL|nr:myb/sant-like dna-binding domain [Holotrichia oblita]